MKILIGVLVLLVVVVVALGFVGYNMLGQALPSPGIQVITTPTIVRVTGPVILSAIHDQSKLETVSIVIANDQDVSRVWGVEGLCQESLTYLGYYTVTAGVDLQDIPQSDIILDGSGDPAQTAVTLNLPPADILHVELDTRRSRTVHSSVSILSQVCGTKLPEMVTEAQKNMRALAEETARQQNIITLAQDRASFELKKILLQLGFAHVTVEFNAAPND